MQKWRLYCETEDCLVFTNSANEPTACPNGEHTIRESSVTHIGKAIPDVTPRQMRQALILSNVSLASVDSALASLSEPQRSLAQAEWEYSTAFERDRPLVAAVGQMLGWTSEQLDNLWLYAGTL